MTAFAPLLTNIPSRKVEFTDTVFTKDTSKCELPENLSPTPVVTWTLSPRSIPSRSSTELTSLTQSSKRNPKTQTPLFVFRVVVLIKADMRRRGRGCHFFLTTCADRSHGSVPLAHNPQGWLLSRGCRWRLPAHISRVFFLLICRISEASGFTSRL